MKPAVKRKVAENFSVVMYSPSKRARELPSSSNSILNIQITNKAMDVVIGDLLPKGLHGTTYGLQRRGPGFDPHGGRGFFWLGYIQTGHLFLLCLEDQGFISRSLWTIYWIPSSKSLDILMRENARGFVIASSSSIVLVASKLPLTLKAKYLHLQL
ncbi:hypothetical protein DPMN_040580 [Dreissena polymorpha]|uniref:Uncharacterized protein n=1 Tax=Dreissena polymorpha TaxID=45954 RepID=A0A9D4HT78_DREPO|nr:hypothetical protein DPMN_040580 [Dreissena polymorpha]